MGRHALRRYPEKSFFILNLESVRLCPSPVLPHEISAQNCAEFEVKQKSKSSWTHSNPGTWKRVLILMENRRASLSHGLGRSQLKSGTFCTVLLGTQFYAFQIQNEKRFLGIAAWGVSSASSVSDFPGKNPTPPVCHTVPRRPAAGFTARLSMSAVSRERRQSRASRCERDVGLY